jgi:hypothetical protein
VAENQAGIFFFVSVAILFLSAVGTSWGKPGVVTHAGALPGGATFLIEVPANCLALRHIQTDSSTSQGIANERQKSL